MSDFAALYREFFQIIGCPLQPEHAFPFEPSTVAPLAVRQFYDVAGRAEERTQSHHRFLVPSEWEHGEFCVFLEENQGVLLWGFRREDAHLADPPVYQAAPEPDAPLNELIKNAPDTALQVRPVPACHRFVELLR